jgi:hypothetical protein
MSVAGGFRRFSWQGETRGWRNRMRINLRLRRPVVRLPGLRLPQSDFGRALEALQRVRDTLVKLPRAEVIQ